MNNIDIIKAINSNHQLQKPTTKHKHTDVFFDNIEAGHGFSKAILKCISGAVIKQFINKLLSWFHIIDISGVVYGISFKSR